MVPASQGFFSMNWNSGEPGSKRYQDERHREGEQRRPQRHPAGVAGGGQVVAAGQHHDEQRAEQRQERRDGKNRPARHLTAPRRQT
jgi:hypothetical protein